MKKRFHLATVIGISLLVAALTYTLTYAAVQRRYSEQLSQEQQTSKRFAKLIRMLDIIDSDFVGDYDSEDLMDSARAVLNDTVEALEMNGVTDWGKIKNEVKNSLSDFVWHETQRRPMIMPILMEV